jgi:hypothetical protein
VTVPCTDNEVSGAGEFHPRALAETDVRPGSASLQKAPISEQVRLAARDALQPLLRAAENQAEPLDNVQLVGVRRAAGIHGGLFVKADGIDDEGVADVTPDRFSIPGRFRIGRMRHVEPDVTRASRQEKHDFLGRLDDMHEARVEMEGGNAGLPASRLARLAVAASEHELILLAQHFPDPRHQIPSCGIVEVGHAVGRRDPHLPRLLVVDVGLGVIVVHRAEPGCRNWQNR